MNYINDNIMVYDINKHRYILTPEGFAELYGIQLSDVLNATGDINSDTLPQRFLDRASLMIYNYIYNWSNNKAEKEYMISLPRYRDSIRDAMGELVYTYLMNNTDPSIFFTEVPNKLITMAPSVHNILINGDLLYRGKYFKLPQDWELTRGTDY